MALSKFEQGHNAPSCGPGTYLHHCHKVHNNHSHFPFLSYCLSQRVDFSIKVLK